jgi:hypothetical protein
MDVTMPPMDTSFAPTSNKAVKAAAVSSDSRTPSGKPRRYRRPRYTQHKPRLRTLEDMDLRCSGAIRAKQLVADLTAELQSDLGGSTALTAGKRELVKHAALLSALAEDFEVAWITKRQPPMLLSEYLQALNVQRRLLVTLGLDRQQREVNPYDDEADRAYARAVAELDREEAQP